MAEHIESPGRTLQLHAKVCARARAELDRQREDIRQRTPGNSRGLAREPARSPEAQAPVEEAILRTLLYFDIWNHPLTLEEIFAFLPVAASSPASLREPLERLREKGYIVVDGDHVAVYRPEVPRENHRPGKERRALLMWKMARVVTSLIKMFPYVRAVWVSGELSKNIASPHADIDFFIVTEARRLWIARSMLILFKKIFLFNSRKFFCVNLFIDNHCLEFSKRNIYQAIEIASVKPLYNGKLFLEYLRANAWVWSYFPNVHPESLNRGKVSERRSLVQRVLESLIARFNPDALDDRLMWFMRSAWKKRYPSMDDQTRDRLLRSTKGESRAYLGDFEERVLDAYRRNLRDYHLAG